VERAREVTVLTQTEVVAVCTNKASSYDGTHVATHTFVLVVGS